jgi:pimeloyl-ACP methyl ester carboxylesterase
MLFALLFMPGVSVAKTAVAVRSEPTTVRSYDGRTMPAEFVSISVAELRARPGRTVSVAALRFATASKTPGRPVVFLMGGPGIPGTVMAPIPPYFTLFQRLREIGDVIVVDQRGIGRSEPKLDCPVEEALPDDALVQTDQLVAVIRKRIAACADQWRGRGADPTAYNTVESADDVADLLTALGIEKADLLAFSYGTRLALVFLQRHEARVGRMVLQGVNGPGLVVKRPGPVTRKLQRLGDLLKQDPAWQGSTDLLAAARAARERFGRAPVAVTINDKRTGGPVTLRVSREGFDAIAALNLDDARLPALLLSVAAGDDRVLSRFVEATWNSLSEGTVGLMARAVNCAADRPAERRELAARETAAAPFGSPIDNAFLTDEFCKAVGYRTPAVEFARPLSSAVPVLMLTGGLDATNPIENARDVALGFPNAVVSEVENAAHEALPALPVQDIVIEYLQGGDVRGRSIAISRPRFPSITEVLQSSPRLP